MINHFGSFRELEVCAKRRMKKTTTTTTTQRCLLCKYAGFFVILWKFQSVVLVKSYAQKPRHS